MRIDANGLTFLLLFKGLLMLHPQLTPYGVINYQGIGTKNNGKYLIFDLEAITNSQRESWCFNAVFIRLENEIAFIVIFL